MTSWYKTAKPQPPRKILKLSEKNQNYNSPMSFGADRVDDFMEIFIDELEQVLFGKSVDIDWDRVGFMLEDDEFLIELQKDFSNDPEELLEIYKNIRDESVVTYAEEVLGIKKTAQQEYEEESSTTDYGAVPEADIGNIGTGEVDKTDIDAVFGADISDKALALVQKHFGHLLTDIAKITVTENSDVYGVFETELTRKLLNNLVQSGMIEQEKAEEFINQGKGIAFRVNPSKIAAEQQALLQESEEQRQLLQKYYPDIDVEQMKQLDEEQIMVLALAETIVHEATHAAGAHDEGSAIAAERDFLAKAINDFNSERGSQGLPEIPVKLK